MKNIEGPELGGEVGEISSETPARKKRGEGMRKHRRRTQEPPEDAILPPNSTFTDDSFARALENLSVPKEETTEPATPETPIVTSTKPIETKAAPEVRKTSSPKPEILRENPVSILRGIKDAKSVKEILDIMWRAHDNEEGDPQKENYKPIGKALDEIQDKIEANAVDKINPAVIEGLTSAYKIKETVKSILGLDKKTEAAPAESVKETAPVNPETKIDNSEFTLSPEYTDERVDEVRNYISENIKTIDPESLMKSLQDDLGLDRKTARGYLDRVLLQELRGRENKNTTKETAPKAETENKEEKVSLRERLINLLTGQMGKKEKKDETAPAASPEIPKEKTTAAKEKSKVVLTEEQMAKLGEVFETEGFLEFLSANPNESFDIEDANNAEKILKMHEAFLVKNEVSKGLSSIATEELNNIIGTDKAESLVSIESYINTQAYENPDKVIDLKNQLDQLNSSREKIAELQGKISEKTRDLPPPLPQIPEETSLEMIKTILDASLMGPRVKNMLTETAKTELSKTKTRRLQFKMSPEAELDKSKIDRLKYFLIETPKGLAERNIVGINREADKQKRAEAQQKIADIMGEPYSEATVAKYIETILDKKTKLSKPEVIDGEISVSTGTYDIARNGLLTEIKGIDGVAEEASNKIKVGLKGVLETKGFDLNTADKAQNILESLKKDPSLASLSDEEFNKFQEDINNMSQKVIVEEMQKAFTDSKINSPLSNIEKYLKNILEKTKVGSKEGTDIRKMIKESLIIVANKSNNKLVNTKVKAFILKNNL